MAEESMLHQTQTGTGHGASSYDERQASEFFREFTTTQVSTMGVLSRALNQLVVSGSASPLSMDTGYAIVYGYRYWNTAVKNFVVTTPVIGNTGGRIVLRQDWAANTVTAELKMSADGNPAIPALTQTPGAPAGIYEISLASFVIDTSGNIWEDVTLSVAGPKLDRSFAVSPLGGWTVLDEYIGDGTLGTIEFKNIQPDLRNLRIQGLVRSDNFASLDILRMQFNGITSATYNYIHHGGQANSAPTMIKYTGGTNIALGNVGGSLGVFASPLLIDIPQYNYDYSGFGTFMLTSQSRLSSWFGVGIAQADAFDVTAYTSDSAGLNRINLFLDGGLFTEQTKITLYGGM